MSNTESKFGAITEPLTAMFGTDFEYWDTGGGCTAIQAFMEGDITIMVTDSHESPNGEEATITDIPTRREVGENTVGFLIGVYADEGSTPLAQCDHPTALVADLPELVAAALDEARKEAAK